MRRHRLRVTAALAAATTFVWVTSTSVLTMAQPAQPPGPPAPAAPPAVPPAAPDPVGQDEPAALAVDVAAPADVEEPEGYTPPEGVATVPALVISGYLDVGFAKATGNGTSFPPVDPRLPADYGVDTFAPMVNTRGDVASTDSGGRFVNGFLPRSVAIGDRPSFLLNTLNLDLRHQTAASPFMVFSRVQLLPRHFPTGNDTRVYVEQAFGRFQPFSTRELNIGVGKFDSVFGIEYLETQSNVRTGITPSLMARYTSGTYVGAKFFVRQHIAPLQSAVSLNVAATNSAPFVEALQPPDVSLTGEPNLSVRVGYELNLSWLQIKLGGSGLAGPRNDQRDRSARQRMLGADARINAFGLSLAGEYVDVKQDAGPEEKQTGQGTYALASGFAARGYYIFGGYTVSPGLRLLARITAYGRYSRRHASFTGFRPIEVASITGGLRLDLGESVILKAEFLRNDEIEGAPKVKNDVYTSSLVYSW